MIPKTDFIKVLEEIHQMTDQRYGQIIYNAMRIFGAPGLRYVATVTDQNLPDQLGAPHFDFFYVYDEDMTKILKKYKDSLK